MCAVKTQRGDLAAAAGNSINRFSDPIPRKPQFRSNFDKSLHVPNDRGFDERGRWNRAQFLKDLHR